MTDEELIYKIARDKEVSIEEATLVLHRSRVWLLAAIDGAEERAGELWRRTLADVDAIRRRQQIFARYRAEGTEESA